MMAYRSMIGFVAMSAFLPVVISVSLATGTHSFACSVPHCNTTTYYGNDCKGCVDGYSLVNDAVWYRCKPHCLLCLDNHYFECSAGSDCNYCCRDPSRCIYELRCSVCPKSYSLAWGTPGFCYPSTGDEDREKCEYVVEPTPFTTTPHVSSKTTTPSDTGDSDKDNTVIIVVVAGAVTVLCIIIIVWCICKRRRKQQKSDTNKDNRIEDTIQNNKDDSRERQHNNLESATHTESVYDDIRQEDLKRETSISGSSTIQNTRIISDVKGKSGSDTRVSYIHVINSSSNQSQTHYTEGYLVPAKCTDRYLVPTKCTEGYLVPTQCTEEYLVPTQCIEGYFVPTRGTDGYIVPSKCTEGYLKPTGADSEYIDVISG